MPSPGPARRPPCPDPSPSPLPARPPASRPRGGGTVGGGRAGRCGRLPEGDPRGRRLQLTPPGAAPTLLTPGAGGLGAARWASRAAPLPSGPSGHGGDTVTLAPTQRRASARQATTPPGPAGVRRPGDRHAKTTARVAPGGPRRPASPAPQQQVREWQGARKPHGSAPLFCLLLLTALPARPPGAVLGHLWHWSNCPPQSNGAPRPACPPRGATKGSPEKQRLESEGRGAAAPLPTPPSLRPTPCANPARGQPSWPEDLGQGNSQLETRRALGSWQCRGGPRSPAPMSWPSRDSQDRGGHPGDPKNTAVRPGVTVLVGPPTLLIIRPMLSRSVPA